MHYCGAMAQCRITLELEANLLNKESLLTPEEAAELLKVSKASVLRLVKVGKLPASRLGRRTIRIRADSLARLIMEATGQAKPPLVIGAEMPGGGPQ